MTFGLAQSLLYIYFSCPEPKEVSKMAAKDQEKPVIGSGVLHPGARPLKVFKDDDGCMWLCDKGINPAKGFQEQGCWRCKDLAFTRND
jgi:hypothetical protein